MGSASRVKKVFRVQLSDFACELSAEGAVQANPYLTIDFDNFKVFKSNAEQRTSTPCWNFKASFEYEISYLEKLKKGSLRVFCWTSQQSLGEASIDLHTLACGPPRVQLTLRNAHGEGTGLARFCCVFQMISKDFSLVFQDLKLSLLPDRSISPESNLQISCNLTEQEIQVPANPESTWSGPLVMSFETSLAELLKAVVTFQLGSATAGISMSSRAGGFKVQVTDETLEMGELAGTLIFQNLPVFAQMTGGLCVDGQVEGGFLLCKGLEFPQSMSSPPPVQEKSDVEEVAAAPDPDDMDDAWYVEALDQIELPAPWQRMAEAKERGRQYFLDPRCKGSKTTWKDPRFLPPHWDQRLDSHGQAYFQHHITHQTTSVDPRGCPAGWDMRLSTDGDVYFAFRPAMKTTFIDPRGIPENFDAALDELGRMYFKNHETQSTTWKDPREGQAEVILLKWRQDGAKRWWKERVRKAEEEMKRLKQLASKADAADALLVDDPFTDCPET